MFLHDFMHFQDVFTGLLFSECHCLKENQRNIRPYLISISNSELFHSLLEIWEGEWSTR